MLLLEQRDGTVKHKHIVGEVEHQLSSNNVLDVTKSEQKPFNTIVPSQQNAINLMKGHTLCLIGEEFL